MNRTDGPAWKSNGVGAHSRSPLGSTVGAWLEPLTRAWSTVALRASTLAVTFARRNQRAGYLALGLANGLLPCGLVYAALAVATAAGDIIHAVLFMVGFGLGTVPALLALTMSAAVVRW